VDKLQCKQRFRNWHITLHLHTFQRILPKLVIHYQWQFTTSVRQHNHFSKNPFLVASSCLKTLRCFTASHNNNVKYVFHCNNIYNKLNSGVHTEQIGGHRSVGFLCWFPPPVTTRFLTIPDMSVRLYNKHHLSSSSSL